MQGCSKLFKGGAAKFTCVSMQHVLGSEDVPPGSFFFFFKSHAQRSVSEAIYGLRILYLL